DPNWFKAKHADGREGLVPLNYLMKRGDGRAGLMLWFHGKICREEAERLLLQNPSDGAFLVRESTNYPGDYTLCVCCNNKVEHYRIITQDELGGLTIDEEEYFGTLSQLVEHYEMDADGLCTRLTHALPKKGVTCSNGTADKRAFEMTGWLIKSQDICIIESIGKGEFGDVQLGMYKGNKVAVKTVESPESRLAGGGAGSNPLVLEAQMMTSLRHRNLVQLLGLVMEADGLVQIVTEYMAKGSLVDYLRSRGRLHVTRRDQINFARDTCAGMAYLESRHVVHRDLAARNVLISDDGVAKVSDFGLAKSQDADNPDVGKFPIKWTAPEALKTNLFSNKTDMWSFGILLWEIYSFGRVPYPRIPLAEVVRHVDKGYRMEAPEGCPPEIYTLMQRAWHREPEERPTFTWMLGKLEQLQRETTASANTVTAPGIANNNCNSSPAVPASGTGGGTS
ncbi:tyrosine-protein kinase CSK-like, partial [Tropilaelaps mercedesae]